MANKIKVSSPSLFRFYSAYLRWLDDGAPEGLARPFKRNWGLCYCLERYRTSSESDLHEMGDQFVWAGLNRNYPFGGELQFDLDLDQDAMHVNKLRVQWVRNRVKDFEEANGL